MNSVREEKDLGVIVTNTLKFDRQCAESYKTANKVLGFIYRNFEYKSKDIILPLYKSLVRPHLEYAVQFWCPYYQKDIDLMERVQRRATKLIPDMRNIPYEDRLKRLNLFSLETSRLRGELIQVFKILHGYDDIDWRKLFNRDTTSVTRSNGFKLRGKRFHTDVAKNFFTYKVTNEWNALPDSVVDTTSINMFKNRLDKVLRSRMSAASGQP